MTEHRASQLLALGASLREIDPSALMPDEEGAQVRWYQGDHATELFAWSYPDASPHHVQLVFDQVSVEWERSRGLVVGTLSHTGSTAGGRYDPYLMTESRAEPALCQAAIFVLEGSRVDEPIKRPLLAALRSAVASGS